MLLIMLWSTVIGYNMARQIIYEWGTCTGKLKSFKHCLFPHVANNKDFENLTQYLKKKNTFQDCIITLLLVSSTLC